ncbi:hypothetical protein L3X38_022797 [Prunus dulcis]|uniref:Uncharacterized protein n=1 Tax=Prunus dulcis TaxID=3755 RepID=A0AAD4VXS6_PRUDU|nr:hypothetical protein L3X38_022797 [Prunus dulcis]
MRNVATNRRRSVMVEDGYLYSRRRNSTIQPRFFCVLLEQPGRNKIVTAIPLMKLGCRMRTRFANGVDEVPVIIECRLSWVVAQVKASDSCIPGDDRRAQTKDAPSTNRNPSAIKEGALCRTELLDDV